MPRTTKTDEEIIEEVETKTADDEFVEVFVPKDNPAQGDAEVFVNFKKWTVARGEFVKVPKEVAEALLHAEKQKRKAYETQVRLGKGGEIR